MYVVYKTGTSYGEGYADILFITRNEQLAKKYCKKDIYLEYTFVEIRN